MGPPPGGPGFGGPVGPPPRKKSSPLVPILLGGGGVVVLLFIVVILIAATADDDDEPTGYPSSSYSSYSASSYSASSSAIGSPTLSSSSSSSSSSSLSSPSESEDGYGSPEKNKIYDTGKAKNVGCRARLPSTGAIGRFARKANPCLNKMWKAQFAREGMTHRSPDIVVSNGSSNSPCSSGDTGYVPAAFYCSVNETIYYSVNQARSQTREHMFATVAHEYGHHVQALAGINEEFNERYQRNYSNVAKRSRMTRRNELQAQCLAGLFVGKNYRTMGESSNIRYAEDRVGDNHLDGGKPTTAHRTHGNYRNNGHWYKRGFDTSNAGSCNTWTAPGSRVA
ncbi:MAG: hypothetical protein GEV07_10545 [Streptosporangiales bacterium]|nr:hypothetical protein [Streptosporangiales bacterium]